MPRTPSYLRNIARRPDRSLPLVRPPRTLMRRWEVATAQDVVSEIMPSLARQRSLAVSSGPDTPVSSLQTPEQRPLEQPSTPAMQKEVEVLLEANSSPTIRPANIHTHSVPAHIRPAIEDGMGNTHTTSRTVFNGRADSTPTTRRQKSEEEIQLTPVKPGEPVDGLASAAGQSILTARSDATAQGKATSEKQHSNVTSRPNARQESRATTTASTSTKGRRTDAALPESDVSTKAPTRPAPMTLVLQAQDRPTDQPYLVAQINAKPQTRTTSEEQYLGVTLRPNARQELTVTMTPITSTRRERTADAALPESDVNTKALLRPARITLVPQAQDRPMASSAKRDTQQESSVHIGTIDIHIMPPPAPPVPLVPSPRALSRELTSFVGLRQG